MPAYDARIVTNISTEENPICSTGKIIVEIDLQQNIKYIKHQFHEIISKESKYLLVQGDKEDKRSHMEARFRQVKTYKAIMDCISFAEIAKETHPEKYSESIKRARDAVNDDFRAGFKLVRRREYIPYDDLKQLKLNMPLPGTCSECESQHPDKYNLCIKNGLKNKDTGKKEWQPLCPDKKHYLNKEQINAKETPKEAGDLDALDKIYKDGKPLYKLGRQKDKEQD